VSWLLMALAALAAVATWRLARGRWDLFMEPAEFQTRMAASRERARQSRLADAYPPADQAEK